jgi:hypothetical protein
MADKKALVDELMRRELAKREAEVQEADRLGVPPLPNSPYDTGRVAFQTVGATLGGAVGGVATGGNPLGAAGGAGLGGLAGEELHRFLTKAHGAEQRFGNAEGRPDTLRERLVADAWAFGSGGTGELTGALVGAGIRGVTKYAMRGGAPRSRVADAVRDFDRAGATPTMGEATGNYMIQMIESVAGRTPGPHGVIIKRAEATSEQIRQAVARRAQWAGGDVLDPEYAGAVAKTGITNWRDSFTQEGSRLEQQFMRLLPPDTPSPAGSYSTELKKFTSANPQAPNVTGRLINPTEQGMLDDIVKDLEVNEGSIPVAALLQQRSRVGELLSNFELVSPVSRGHAKDLYRALSDDIRATMVGNPQALAAFDARNAHWKQGMERIDNFLNGMMRKGIEPEKLFDSIFRSTKGTTLIRELRGTLSPDEWRIMSGAVLRRMGYKGTAEDELTWDSMRFLTQWKDMPGPTKDALFGASGQALFRRDLDQIAAAIERQRKMYERFGNPPKTASGLIGGALITGGIIGAAYGDESFLIGLAAIGGGGWAGAKYLLTNPNFVHWLASSSRITGGPAAVSNHIAKLGAVAATADPETREAILEYLGAVKTATAANWAKQQQPPQPQPVPTGP